MIVVADASPFVVLVAIGHIDLLPTLFTEVLIPPEVASELASSKRPADVREFIATPPAWLCIRAPWCPDAIPGLDAGETAAIALAEEVQAGRLIIDEYRGRKAATERGLRVVGTIGVLELAAEMGFIDLAEAFRRVKQTDFWISHTFLDERLALFSAQAGAMKAIAPSNRVMPLLNEADFGGLHIPCLFGRLLADLDAIRIPWPAWGAIDPPLIVLTTFTKRNQRRPGACMFVPIASRQSHPISPLSTNSSYFT